MDKAGAYIIENLLDGEVYVGQSVHMLMRWGQRVLRDVRRGRMDCGGTY